MYGIKGARRNGNMGADAANATMRLDGQASHYAML